MTENKPGRNDPCPCGSGKKYKNCHLGKQEEPKKTYTASGKRKFTAKVIKVDKNQELFQAPFNPVPYLTPNESNEAVALPLAEHDFRLKKEGETSKFKRAASSDPESQNEGPPTTLPPDEFKPASTDYRKK